MINDEAIRLGFAACGFTRPVIPPHHIEYFDNWLSKNYQAGMKWMDSRKILRHDPLQLVPGTKTIVVFLLNYYSDNFSFHRSPKMARYALGNDYHYIIKNKLSLLLDFIKKKIPDVEGRFFCDSAPVLEKILAQQAGLGWIGKNTCLINPVYGSWCFIGILFLSIELPADEPFIPECGNCSVCLNACPNKALEESFVLNANKCISYQTIENRNSFPEGFNTEQYIFGCDLCQLACPWNKNAKPANQQISSCIDKISELTAAQWKNLDKITYKKYFRGTPVERAGFLKLKRNIEYFFQQAGSHESPADTMK